LRNSTTSLKVAVSIPCSVIGIFHLNNPVCRNMPFGSTQTRPEMSYRNIFVGECLQLNILEACGAVIGMYSECLTLVSPVGLASFSPVFSNMALWHRDGKTNF
jgi:hypothetical protein